MPNRDEAFDILRFAERLDALRKDINAIKNPAAEIDFLEELWEVPKKPEVQAKVVIKKPKDMGNLNEGKVTLSLDQYEQMCARESLQTDAIARLRSDLRRYQGMYLEDQNTIRTMQNSFLDVGSFVKGVNYILKKRKVKQRLNPTANNRELVHQIGELLWYTCKDADVDVTF